MKARTTESNFSGGDWSPFGREVINDLLHNSNLQGCRMIAVGLTDNDDFIACRDRWGDDWVFASETVPGVKEDKSGDFGKGNLVGVISGRVYYRFWTAPAELEEYFDLSVFDNLTPVNENGEI